MGASSQTEGMQKPLPERAVPAPGIGCPGPKGVLLGAKKQSAAPALELKATGSLPISKKMRAVRDCSRPHDVAFMNSLTNILQCLDF